VPRRLVLALVSTGLSVGALTATAGAAVDVPPTVGTPAIVANTAASARVSVEVDTHDAETTVTVEYVTAGAYRAHRVPGAAKTLTIATLPASSAGPVVVTGQVAGLDPGSTYRMRVKAVNAGGETVSADLTVSTPRAPKIIFKAKVGKNATTLTKLKVTGLVGAGAETVKVRCKTVAKGCPFASATHEISGHLDPWTSAFRGHPLKPGAKVVIQVLAADSRVASLTLTMRGDQQPKVKRT
jgi:hypothetical protein